MRKVNIITIAAVGALMLWGCDVKDPIYETDHPDKGAVTVKADWSNIGQGITKPAKWTVAVGSREGIAENTDSHAFKDAFDPGNYTVYAWNPADHFTFSGTTATVASEGTGLHAQPDWLFTAKLQATVQADRKHEFTAVMQQQVRELTLVIEATGSVAPRISAITSTLSGVAGSYDMESGAHGSASAVAFEFTKQTTGDYAGKWTATVRLLGVTGSRQLLKSTIKFIDGIPTDIPLDNDLSGALATFNDNKREPFVLGGQAAETPTEAGFTATINGWTRIQGGSGTAG